MVICPECHVSLSGYNDDNVMLPGAEHRSPSSYLTGEENLG
jgi:hypothetical protein